MEDVNRIKYPPAKEISTLSLPDAAFRSKKKLSRSYAEVVALGAIPSLDTTEHRLRSDHNKAAVVAVGIYSNRLGNDYYCHEPSKEQEPYSSPKDWESGPESNNSTSDAVTEIESLKIACVVKHEEKVGDVMGIGMKRKGSGCGTETETQSPHEKCEVYDEELPAVLEESGLESAPVLRSPAVLLDTSNHATESHNTKIHSDELDFDDCEQNVRSESKPSSSPKKLRSKTRAENESIPDLVTLDSLSDEEHYEKAEKIDNTVKRAYDGTGSEGKVTVEQSPYFQEKNENASAVVPESSPKFNETLEDGATQPNHVKEYNAHSEEQETDSDDRPSSPVEPSSPIVIIDSTNSSMSDVFTKLDFSKSSCVEKHDEKAENVVENGLKKKYKPEKIEPSQKECEVNNKESSDASDRSDSTETLNRSPKMAEELDRDTILRPAETNEVGSSFNLDELQKEDESEINLSEWKFRKTMKHGDEDGSSGFSENADIDDIIRNLKTDTRLKLFFAAESLKEDFSERIDISLVNNEASSGIEFQYEEKVPLKVKSGLKVETKIKFYHDDDSDSNMISKNSMLKIRHSKEHYARSQDNGDDKRVGKRKHDQPIERELFLTADSSIHGRKRKVTIFRPGSHESKDNILEIYVHSKAKNSDEMDRPGGVMLNKTPSNALFIMKYEETPTRGKEEDTFDFETDDEMPVQDPPVEIDLFVTSKNMLRGCTKRVKWFRTELTPNGRYEKVEKSLLVPVKPKTKIGTKITFCLEGDRSEDKMPSDLIFTVRRKLPMAEKKISNRRRFF